MYDSPDKGNQELIPWVIFSRTTATVGGYWGYSLSLACYAGLLYLLEHEFIGSAILGLNLCVTVVCVFMYTISLLTNMIYGPDLHDTNARFWGRLSLLSGVALYMAAVRSAVHPPLYVYIPFAAIIIPLWWDDK